MTVQLDWPREVVDRLTAEARVRGLSLDDYVLQSVLRQQAPDGIASGEDSKRAEREEAGRRIRELRKSNTLGPDLTVRDLIEEGRRF